MWKHKWLFLGLMAIIVGIPMLTVEAQGEWSTPTELWSETAGRPSISAAPDGSVHVFWDTRGEESNTLIMHAAWYGGAWTEPNDILALSSSGGTAAEAAIDNEGMVHLTWIDQRKLKYHSVHLSKVSDAREWLGGVVIDEPVVSPARLLVDGSVLHLFYILLTDGDTGSILLHRQSLDEGTTWSLPVAISETIKQGIGPISCYASLDESGRIHVVWYEVSFAEGAFPGHYAAYARSTDGGQTWTLPWVFDSKELGNYFENSGPFFPSVASIGSDHVHIVWDGPPSGYRHHIQSFDGGESWTPSQRIAEFRGINQWNDMSVDSVGHIHLISSPYEPQVLYMEWDGERWLGPEIIASRSQTGLPRLVVNRGNQVHAVWIEVDTTSDNQKKSSLWHSMRILNVPALPTVITSPPSASEVISTTRALPTPTGVHLTSERPVATPVPLDLTSRGDPMGSTSPWLALVAGVVPAALLIGIVMLFTSARRRQGS